MPDVDFGNLKVPVGQLHYYEQKTYRFDRYVIFLANDDFFERNSSSIIGTPTTRKFNSEGSYNFLLDFEDVLTEHSIDFELDHTYYAFDTNSSLIKVEGLTNNKNQLYLLRVTNY